MKKFKKLLSKQELEEYNELKQLEEWNEFKREKKELNKNKFTKIIQLGIIFLLGLVIIYSFYKVDIDVNAGTSLTVASISIMINVIILGVVFGTGIGQKVLKKFKQKFLYNKGRHVNTILINKNGILKEYFIKVNDDDKSFIINKQKFIRNPRLLNLFDKIPTYLHREGSPDPLNVWTDKLAGDMSNKEIDEVMNAKDAFDFKAFVEQNKIIIVFSMLIIISLVAISVYFGFNISTMLRDGSYKAVECILPPNNIIPAIP